MFDTDVNLFERMRSAQKKQYINYFPFTHIKECRLLKLVFGLLQQQPDGLVESHLCMKRVERDSFRKYTLFVDNKIATVAHAVLLSEREFNIALLCFALLCLSLLWFGLVCFA